jgi:predicted nucleic acid-binding protein
VTAAKVVDASALAASIFLEPGYAAIQARMHGCTLHAPVLLRFEMANVAIKKIRKSPAERDLVLLQHDSSVAIPIVEHDVDQRQVVGLAERMKLTAYDASYLWLAKHLNCELVTLDEKLAAAAQSL